jgi:hypothetical protein
VSGTVPTRGATTISGTFDFEEPFFVDPPLVLNQSGHATLSATVINMINKSVGTGTLTSRGRVGFATASFGYQVAVIKQLFSVTLAQGGRTTLSGSIGSTSVKSIGSGSMAMGGRSTIGQSGFQIQAPAPYTHPLGSLSLALIGDAQPSGDPISTFFPPHDMGSASMSMSGTVTVSTSRLFAGGLLEFPYVYLYPSAKTSITSRFSYPGETYPDTEAVAVYEGVELQEVYADLEGDDVVVQ